MFHADSSERSAVQELMALHIDMGIRRVAPFPAEKYAALQDAVQRYAPATPPKGAGRRIALPDNAACPAAWPPDPRRLC